MASFTNFNTQRLTRARLELVAGRGRLTGWLTAVLISMLVVAAALAVRQAPGALDIISLLNSRRENTRLQSELQRTRLELDVEHATRTELERRNQALGEQVTALNQQLEFVNSRTNGQTRTVPTPPPAAESPEE